MECSVAQNVTLTFDLLNNPRCLRAVPWLGDKGHRRGSSESSGAGSAVRALPAPSGLVPLRAGAFPERWELRGVRGYLCAPLCPAQPGGTGGSVPSPGTAPEGTEGLRAGGPALTPANSQGLVLGGLELLREGTAPPWGSAQGFAAEWSEGFTQSLPQRGVLGQFPPQNG